MGVAGVDSSPLPNPSAVSLQTYGSRLQAMTSNARRMHLVKIILFFNSTVLVPLCGEAFPSFSLRTVSAAAQHALAIATTLVAFPLGFP